MIKFIFVARSGTSGLAYVPRHCVTGLPLPPVDANSPFITAASLTGASRKGLTPESASSTMA